MKSILIQAWTLYKKDDILYLPYTHWIYLKEIATHYDYIYLLSSVIKNDIPKNLIPINNLKNIEVYSLPESKNYSGAIKYFFSYLKIYFNIRKKNYSVSYVRYPTPFGWLQRVFIKKPKKIIHFVGDPIDTVEKNPNFSLFKKKLLTSLFLPEHLLYIWACKKNVSVYTNGTHLSKKLNKHGIYATPLISSTLQESDFYINENKIISNKHPKIIYVGYLRKAKGVETVIATFSFLKKKYPNSSLTIVGTGELEEKLKSNTKHLSNINFLGHIDDRKKLNNILREHDIFCFCSLSEGSPRVILEAMANGLNVVSTPVGSLPDIFQDGVNILFSKYNNEKDFSEKIEFLIDNPNIAKKIRTNSFHIVKKFQLSSFIKEIFK